MDEGSNLRSLVIAQQSYINNIEKNTDMYKKILLKCINDLSFTAWDTISLTCIDLGQNLLKLFYNFNKKDLYPDVNITYKPPNSNELSPDELKKEFLDQLLKFSEIIILPPVQIQEINTNKQIKPILQTFYDYQPSINGIRIRLVCYYENDTIVSLGCFIRLTHPKWKKYEKVHISIESIDNSIQLYNYLISMDRVSSTKEIITIDSGLSSKVPGTLYYIDK
jgi:hypothetical protein